MNRRKAVIALGLAALMAFGAPTAAFAEETAQTAANLEGELAAVEASIDSIEAEKTALMGEMDDLQGQLVKAIASVESLTTKITELEAQMKVTKEKLTAAKGEQAVQYEGMKARIQYLYETGGEAGWAAVFMSGGDVSDILNKAEYTQQMYAYDRDQLEQYITVVNQVEDLQRQEKDEKASLEVRKQEQMDLQSHLEELMQQARDSYDNFDSQLEQLYAKAAQWQVLIVQQNEAFARMMAEEQAAAEQAAAVQAAQAAYYYYNNTTSGDAYANTAAAMTGAMDTGYTADAGYTDGTDVTYTQDAGGGETAYTGSGSGGGASYTESANSSSGGAAVLAYAQQFLGNPYVYGGNSLTDGVDCSGFVQQVYSNFGISTSRTSWDIENDGQAVSYNDVQVGDLLCYDGHVGIYAGDGQIINAIDDAHGIGYSDAKFSEVTTIRRYM